MDTALDTSKTYYSVLNTESGERFSLPGGGFYSTDKRLVKNHAAFLNSQFVPEFQTLSVATINFDSEV